MNMNQLGKQLFTHKLGLVGVGLHCTGSRQKWELRLCAIFRMEINIFSPRWRQSIGNLWYTPDVDRVVWSLGDRQTPIRVWVYCFQCCHSSHGVPPTEVAYFPLLSPTGPTINYNALLFVLPPFVGQGSRGGSFPAQRIMGISLKTFTSTPPPLGHCPRDVTRPPENWKTPPLLNIHKHPPPPWTLPVWRHPYSSGTLYIVTLCGYITSSTVLCCEGRKEPRHGSLRIIFFSPHWKHWIYLGLPTNPHNMVIFPVDLGFPYNLLNIPTNPHNMVIFPVGFPYNLQRAKSPYCRGIPLRVATLIVSAVARVVAFKIFDQRHLAGNV